MKEPLDDALEALARLIEPWMRVLKEIADAITPYAEAVLEWGRGVGAFHETGWLPYHSMPFHEIEECGDNRRLLDRRFDEYFRANWREICTDLEQRLEGYHVDDEAKATFREALTAHEEGLYRCVCRVLFPEIERAIALGRVRKKELGQILGDRSLGEVVAGERFAYVLFSRLVSHTYEQVRTSRARFEQDPLPNRHAAMHGLVSYRTHKNSMNMLLMTDYIFRLLRPRSHLPPVRQAPT